MSEAAYTERLDPKGEDARGPVPPHSEQLQFETLLSNLSARFVNVPADQVDSEIQDAQRRVCECLGLDLSALWQWSNEGQRYLTQTHLYRPLGGPPPPERIDAQEMFPWCLQQMIAGTIIRFSSVEELPPEAARDREVWHHYGIKSVVAFPLSAGGGQLIGTLGFNTMREERAWPDETINRLQLVAQIFANALVRKEADKALRESEERLSLAAASANAGLWGLDVTSGHIWATEKARELTGLAPGQEFDFETFLNMVHPDDREQVRQAVQQSLQSGTDSRIEYRILFPDGRIRWLLSRGRRRSPSSEESVHLMGVTVDITEQKRMEIQLKENLREIEELKCRLEKDNIYLQEEISLLLEPDEIVGQSSLMKNVLAQAEQVAKTDSTVLIQGETGTGKELLARAIHRMSCRRDRPLVTVNCASLPPTLIENELFGREKGAYTGALTKMIGRFENADGSTLFLDEIGEFPFEIQSKLLRVLEEGNFERLGSTQPLRVDVRIIAATNRDLEQDVKEGKFRRDLFYRLNVFPIVIPPLRERSEDIPLMVWAFVREFQKKMGKEIETIPKKTMEALQSYSWPGNVRELRNVIERAMIIIKGRTLEVRLPDMEAASMTIGLSLQEIERTHILKVLERTAWRVAGKGGAADILDMNRTTLQAKMKKLGINRPGH